MARFSDINRAAELTAAHTKYKAWQAKTRAQKDAAFDLVNKPDADRVNIDRVPGFILPFLATSAGYYFEAQVLPAAIAGPGSVTALMVRGLIKTRFADEVPASSASIKVRGYKFAKVVASERTETAKTKDKSRFTDNPYKRHRSNNVSCPFGRTSVNAAENFATAVADIKNDGPYKTFAAVKGNRIGITPESE